MTQPIVLYGGFSKGVNPVTGLTVTVNVYRVTRASGATMQIVTGGSATEVGDGVYLYAVAAADLQTYDYLAAFKTTGDVDAKTIWAIYPALANAYSTELARLDATISSRNAVAPLDATATQAAAAAALTAYDPATGAEVAGLPDALLDGEEVSIGVTVREALAAAGSAGDSLTNPVGGYTAPQVGYYLQRLANTQVEIVSAFDPVTQALSFLYGDDYATADDRSLSFTTTHDLSGVGTVVRWNVRTPGTITQISCTIVDASTYVLAPTSANLTTIGVGEFDYDIEIVLPGTPTRTITEREGVVTVRRDVR
jgi:hypothetical protein